MTHKNFQKSVWDFYKENKRDLPWRPKKGRKVTSYEILVSEYMLQQTQVDRVVPKFIEFTKHFPNFQTLAKAKDKDVLRFWSGLGYNRRALYLKSTVKNIHEKYADIVPREKETLKTFPGVGDYMAAVLPVFLYNQKEVLIETNVRTVYLYHFFKDAVGVSDKDIGLMIQKTLPEKDFREWYYALMDYGSYLKKEKKVNNKNHQAYTKQKPFKGSLRYVRGRLVKILLTQKIWREEVYALFPNYTKEQIDKVVVQLLSEKFIKENKKYFYL